MCTVSFVPTSDGVRCVFNRDESLARPLAHHPVARRLGARRAVFPVDPWGGGSWIGANDAGLVAMVLNRSAVAPRSSSRYRLSRGTLVPGLLEHASLDDAAAGVSRLDATFFGPFLIVMSQGLLVRAISSSDIRRFNDCALVRPLMFTTSAIGDALVDAQRRECFDQLVLRSGHWLDAQDTFHRQQCAARPALGVVMRRNGAATVSRTTIEMDSERTSVRYEELCPTSGDVSSSSRFVVPRDGCSRVVTSCRCC